MKKGIPLRFLANLNPVKSETKLSPDDLVSFVPLDAVSENGGLRLDQEKELEDVYTGYTYFKNGDIVLAKITPCFENGKASIAQDLTNETAFGTTELHVIRPEKIDKRYLFYLVCSSQFREVGESTMYGAGGQKRLPESFLANYKVPINDLPTQQKIATYLDERTTRLDALITAKERLLDLLAERRAALITRAVTRGLDENVELKDSGVDWLGEIPVGWEVKRLRHLSTIIGGGTPTTTKDEYWKGEIPWVSPKDMKFEKISSTQDYVTRLGVEKSPCIEVPVNTMIMVVRSGILRHSIPVAITAVPVVLNQDMKAFIVNDLVRSYYLYYLFHGLQKDLLPILTKPGSTVESIEMQYLLDLKFPLPSVNTQDKIISQLQLQLGEFDQTKIKITHSLRLLREYRAALITAAVNGEVAIPAT